MSDDVTISPLGEPRCSRQGCTATAPNASAALRAGWVMVAGKWFCPPDFAAEADRMLDDMEPVHAFTDEPTLDVDPEDP